MYKKILVICLPIIAIMFLLYSWLHRVPEGKLPAWSLDAASSPYLATQFTLQGYSIRPPLGYDNKYADSLKALDAFGLNMYEWYNVANRKNASGLSIQIIRRPNLDSPREFLNYQLKMESKDEKNFFHTNPEVGKVNNLIFARAHWTGIEQDPSGSYSKRGFFYCTTDAMKGICISGYDRVPCNSDPCNYQSIDQQALSVTEAAALSFHSL